MRNAISALFATLLIALTFAVAGCSDPVSAMEPTTIYTLQPNQTADLMQDTENPQHDTCQCNAGHNTIDDADE